MGALWDGCTVGRVGCGVGAVWGGWGAVWGGCGVEWVRCGVGRVWGGCGQHGRLYARSLNAALPLPGQLVHHTDDIARAHPSQRDSQEKYSSDNGAGQQ